MQKLYTILLLIWLGSGLGTLQASELPPGFVETQVVAGLNPVAMTQDHHGRMWIVEKNGTVRIVDSAGYLLPVPFIVLPVDDYNERGLLGIALHPDFHAQPYVYLYYTVPGQNRNRVSRFLANGDLAVPGSEEILMDLDVMPGFIHNGGAMCFDVTGHLLIATGEGAQPPAAQDLNSTLGKILRIAPDGSIPPDNPFYDSLSGPAQAIWAYGLRNPFSMTIDPLTLDLYVADVGGGAYEEVNRIRAGGNYGWPLIEGPRDQQALPPDYEDPVYAYDHDAGCAIVGAAFSLPGPGGFPATYDGGFFFGDYCEGTINWRDLAGAVHPFATGVPRPLALAFVPETGDLYYLTREGIGGGSPADNTSTQQGALWRVSYVGEGPPQVSVDPRSQLVPLGESVTFQVQAQGSQPLTYQWLRDGQPVAGATDPQLTLLVSSLSQDGQGYRCLVHNAYGEDTSANAQLAVTANQRPQPQIEWPQPGATFRAGDSLTFRGYADDPETGRLPDSALTWWVVWHHARHTHPGAGPFTGVGEGGWQVPVVNETDPDVWYRLYLRATDSTGLAQVLYRDMYPELCTLRLEGPPGLVVNIDGKLATLPASFPSVIGLQRTIEVPDWYVVGDSLYRWQRWADGYRERLRQVIAPAAGRTWRLEYEALPLGQGSGLWAAYYDDPELDLDGEPTLERLDTTLHFNWGDGSPVPDQLPRDYFTVRWKGEVQAVFGETYTFYVRADDGYRLWIGDSLLIDRWGPQAPTEHSGDLTLAPGERRPLLLEYMELKGGAEISLQWSSPSTPKAVVPRRQLYPAPFFYPAQVTGEVWDDRNQNGFRDVGEPPLADVPVLLRAAADSAIISQHMTGAEGDFLFGQLPAGSFFVQVLSQGTGTWWRPGGGLDAWGRSPVFDLVAGSQRHVAAPLMAFSAQWAETPLPDLVVFPNPAVDWLHLRFWALLPQQNLTLRILDLQGREVLRQHIHVEQGPQAIRLPVHHLPPGAYLLEVQTPQGRVSRLLRKD